MSMNRDTCRNHSYPQSLHSNCWQLHCPKMCASSPSSVIDSNDIKNFISEVHSVNNIQYPNGW